MEITEFQLHNKKISISDRLQKLYYGYVVRPFLLRYLRHPSRFRYGRFRLTIQPSVFHPAFFFSTKLLASFTKTLELEGKKFCEVGAGSGLISFIAFDMGAEVYSFDINTTAVNAISKNLASNFKGRGVARFHISQSDLFDNIPRQRYDVIMINPPYYFKQPKDENGYSWYCGSNGEYFQKLFKQLKNYSDADSEIYMILAENCDIERISDIASEDKYILDLVFAKKVRWECNFVFRIQSESDVQHND
jgi:release factor glutamine methyltransferase